MGGRRLARIADVVMKPDVNADAFQDRLIALRPDLLVSWFWTTRIPKRILAVPPRGAIGVHPSLLPRHRGPDPYFWAIDSGDRESGVTAHRLDEGYDTGDILGQHTVRIDPAWNAWTLARRLDRPSLALLRETVAAFARGSPPAPRPQDERAATLAPEPTDDDLALLWTGTNDQILRRVRAASPWPGAIAWLGDVPVYVTRAAARADFPRALLAGEAAVLAGGAVVVRTSNGAVELLETTTEEHEPLSALGLAALLRAPIHPASR